MPSVRLCKITSEWVHPCPCPHTHTHTHTIYVTNGRQPRCGQRSRRPVCTVSRQAQSEQKHGDCLAALGAFLQYRMHGDVGQHLHALNTTPSSVKTEACRTKPRQFAQHQARTAAPSLILTSRTTQGSQSRYALLLPAGSGPKLSHSLQALWPPDKWTSPYLWFSRLLQHTEVRREQTFRGEETMRGSEQTFRGWE